MTAGRGKRREWLSYVLPVAVMLALLAAGAYLLHDMLGSKGGKPKRPPKISLLPDKPPPPPPPKEEKKPEPPERKEVKVETPQEPQPQAQNEPLKMEGAAGDGPSPFAAGTVTRENDFNTGARLSFAFYTNHLQRYLQEELAKNKRLRATDYRVMVRVWLARDGGVQRVELAGSSGDAEVDAAVRSALGAIAAVKEPPPENMPQPVKLRISNRGAG